MASQSVVILGGGAGGCGTALKLADDGWEVTLIEKNKLLSRSSNRTPGRMGLGFHYIHFNTCKVILHEAITYAKTFPGYRLGDELPWSHPLRHGRYFITKTSLFSATEILNNYEQIKEYYAKLVEEDPSNGVFGPPEELYRILDPSEYEHLVDVDNVEVAVETAEHCIDWRKLKRLLTQKVFDHERITVREDTEVIDAKKTDNGEPRFLLTTRFAGKEKTIATNYVVNSTWSEIERLNTMAGFCKVPKSRSNRLKAIVEVKLPETLVNANSMFFCMGPFCMFSNMGGGRGLLTYAPFTNIDASEEVAITSRMERLLEEGPTDEEYEEYSQRIFSGVCKFIPPMREAQVVSLQFGIVQTLGRVDLYNRKSDFHCRDYHGVRAEGRGWVSAPCMKLLNFIENGNIISDILTRHLQLDQES